MQLDNISMIAVEAFKPHPFNQSVYGDPQSGSDFPHLVESIRLHGVLEPIIATSELIILNGHRRVAAASRAGLKVVPARTLSDLNERAQQDLIIALNQHRKRLPSTMVREAIAAEHLVLNNETLTSKNGNAHKLVNGLASRFGFKNRRMLEQARKIVLSGDDDLIGLMDEKTITAAYRKLHRRQNGISQFSSVIKPSDNWNFSPVKYERINGEKIDGYIPGDIYANCFWYFVKPEELVVDPMAGSGMARYVYEHRDEWMGNQPYDFRLQMFDLTPQTEDITAHDLLSGFPVDKPDYIFLDLPYLGMSKYAYSKKEQDLANMDESTYLSSINRIALACASSQSIGKLCTVVSPNYTDHQSLRVINMAEHIRESWRKAGYRLFMETYASRRIQQRQHPTMAKINNVAKERRLPLTDIVLIMTFERCS
jgi:hypothetical protein